EIDVLNEKADILPKEEIEIIRSAILKKMKNDRIPLSNMGLNNLIIHIAIACKRIRTENYVSLFPKDMDHILHQKEYQAAEAIVKELESKLSV
ncbi:PRD domain-containing protein, partial [Enterococcus faecalis]